MPGAKKKSKLRVGRILFALGVSSLVASMLLDPGTLRWALLGMAFVFLASAIVTFMKARAEVD